MGKLGYATLTLTDLTETLPVSIVLETNKDKNIQIKTGTLYTPDFEGEELIITPSLFLGQEEIDLNEKSEYVKPNGRTSGFIYYEIGSTRYQYNENITEGIRVDELGRLIYPKNLTENILIEAYLEDFYVEEHNYSVDLVQAINPINFLLLEEGSENYSVIISSTSGRQHFEETNAESLELFAELYHGIDKVEEEENLEYTWYKLTDGTDKIFKIGKNIKVTRDDVYSEEKFLCKILDTKTNLTYTGTIDIWDLKEKYSSTLSSNGPLIISEDFKDLTLTVSTFDEKGVLIGEEGDGYLLSYQWGYISEDKNNDIIGEINNTLTISKNSIWLPKSQNFSIYCRVYNKSIIDREDGQPIYSTAKQISAVVEQINFVPIYSEKITPESIYIPTGDDGITYEGNENWTYTFSFQLLDKNGQLISFDDSDSNLESISSGTDADGTVISFVQKDSTKWDFTGTIKLSKEGELWSNKELGSKLYEFTFVYYGQQFTRGINIIKNKVGMSSFKTVIHSSSGTTLTSSDTSTILNIDAYYGTQKLGVEKQYYFAWKKDDAFLTSITLPDNSIKTKDDPDFYIQDKILVTSKDFEIKSVYSCYIFSTKDNAEAGINWVDFGEYTLIDLTETLAATLTLQTNQNIQIKKGDIFEPDFNKNELIITPSLYIGSEKEDIPINNIYYQVGKTDSSGNEIDYFYNPAIDPTKALIYVDNQGRLHYKENLTKNLVVEVYIKDFKTEIYDYLINAINPINISFLEEGNSLYTAIIESNGREHFGEGNTTPIYLTAKLFKGADEVTEGITYSWDKVSDTDNGDNDFSAETKNIEVKRGDISSVEVFTCIFKLSDGRTFSASKIIRDFTDAYTNQILAKSSLILTPNNSSVELENQIWYDNGIINGEGSDSSRFAYKWSILKSDGSEIELTNTEKTLKVIVGSSSYPKENFSILGKVIIDGKAMTLNYADIKYQPVSYSVNISPSTLFVAATNDGKFKANSNNVFNIKFQLLDDNKQSLIYDSDTSLGPSLTTSDNSTFSVSRVDNSKWDFDIVFTLDINSDSNTLWESKDSKTYEFTYKYLGENFTQQFEVIKNYAGEQGKPGVSGNPGYTVDLSSSFHAFSGGEAIATPGEGTSFEISAFYGDDEKEIDQVYISEDSNKTNLIGAEYLGIEGLIISGRANGNKVIISLTTDSGDKALKKGGTLALNIVVGSFTFYKTFNYIINYNGKSYYLSFGDDNTITYSNSLGVYNPSQITIQAFARETNGVASLYDKGIILYSYDKNIWQWLSSSTLSFNEIFNNLYVRLYSAQASSLKVTGQINNELLNDNAKFLLDDETIPVLISLEGAEIGGENLIPWSKTLPTSNEENKGQWISPNVNTFFIEIEQNFGVMNFNSSNNYIIDFASPFISFDKSYKERSFCFSCWVYSDDWSKLSNSLDFKLGFIDADNEIDLDSISYSKILTIGSISNNSTVIFDEQKSSGIWQRIYKIFKLEELTSTDYSNFRVIFSLNTNGNIKIKKPKLELGTVPTDWSMNSFDNEDFINKVKEELKKETDGLKSDFVKFGNSSLIFSNEEEDKINLSVITGIDKDGLAKLGNSEAFLQPITITRKDGTKVTFCDIGEFKGYLEELNKKNAENVINYSSTLISEKLGTYESMIKLHTAQGDDTETYILINAAYSENGNVKYSESLRLRQNKLSFYVDGQETAYMSNNKLFIPHGQITSSLIIGADPENTDNVDSHLKIFVIDGGVGFIWEDEQ